MSIAAILKVQCKRLVSRLEFCFAITVVLVITAVAFIECCIRFYGFDVNALPSAAYGWTWNMDALQIQAMRVFAYFLIFIIAASVFADNYLQDKKSNVDTYITTRCPFSSYIVSNAILSFVGGFFIVFLPLLISQLLAFLLFPVIGTFDGHFTVPVYEYWDESGTLFPEIAFNHLYLNNVIYLLYAPFFAASMALLSFSFSLFIKNRLAILGIPTVFVLVSWFLVPLLKGSPVADSAVADGLATEVSTVTTHFQYLFPGLQTMIMSPVYFALAPIVVLTLSIALIFFGLRKKDIQL